MDGIINAGLLPVLRAVRRVIFVAYDKEIPMTDRLLTRPLTIGRWPDSALCRACLGPAIGPRAQKMLLAGWGVRVFTGTMNFFRQPQMGFSSPVRLSGDRSQSFFGRPRTY